MHLRQEVLATGEVGITQKGQTPSSGVLRCGKHIRGCCCEQPEFLSILAKQVAQFDTKIRSWLLAALLPALDRCHRGAQLFSQVLLTPVATNAFLAQHTGGVSHMRSIHTNSLSTDSGTSVGSQNSISW